MGFIENIFKDNGATLNLYQLIDKRITEKKVI